MVQILSRGISDFTFADAGNLAVPMPESPLAFRRGSRLEAVDGYGFTGGLVPSNRSCKWRRRRSATRPHAQRWGLRHGECR
jgi:hypothetical protein